MIDPYIKAILEYLISPAIVIAGVVYVLNKVYKLGELKATWEMMRDSISSIQNDIKEIKARQDRDSTDLTIIKTHLVAQLGLKAELFGSSSPLTLKKKGQELLHKTSYETYLKKHTDVIFHDILQYRPENLAEFDEASFALLDSKRESSEFKKYEQIAFDNGVSYDVLLKVLAIYTREQLKSRFLEEMQVQSKS